MGLSSDVDRALMMTTWSRLVGEQAGRWAVEQAGAKVLVLRWLTVVWCRR